MKINGYWVGLIVLTIIMTAIILVLNQTELTKYFQPIHPWLPVIFMGLSAGEHTVLVKTIRRQTNRFSQAFIAASSAKLLMILLVTVIYLLIDKSQVIAFVIVLFVNYLVFTIFEVRALLRLVQGNK